MRSGDDLWIGFGFEPAHEPFDGGLLAFAGDGVRGIFLNYELGAFGMAEHLVSFGGGLERQAHTGERGESVGVAIDDQEGAWGDHGQDAGPVERRVDAWNHAVVEGTNRVAIRFFSRFGSDFFENRLDGIDASEPLIVFECPGKTLNTDEGNGDGDARIHGGCEVTLDSAFGYASQADSLGIDGIHVLEQIHESGDIPDGVIVEWMFLALLERPIDG